MRDSLLQNWLLPWATLAVSLFNTVLLGWLGFTVLLSAQTRSWGNTLASCGLLLGGAFFLAHSAALDYSLEALLAGSPSWWMFVAIPLLCLPFGWMILMLWECGFWDEAASKLGRRARFPLALCIALFATLVTLCIYGAPHQNHLPFGELARGNGATYFSMRAISLLYPPFLVGCIGVSLYALKNPVPTGKMVTQEARRRARPYLLASSVVQFLGSCGIALALVAFGAKSFSSSLYGLYNDFEPWINAADLVVCLGISVAVMLLGKAVVSFEIFTGKILPRRGFLRQWRTIVTLAACYSSLLSACLGFEMRSIFPLLLTTALMTAFLAIFSARATRDHERAVQSIAPFVASQHLTSGLLSGDAAPLQRALDEPFRALCEDVLGASRAVLIARGAHATLCGAPRIYPPSLPFRAEWTSLVAALHSPSREAIALPLDCGMNYLVPLGSAPGEAFGKAHGKTPGETSDMAHNKTNGDMAHSKKSGASGNAIGKASGEDSGENEAPLGALLLGPKRDGGLYTAEEIEVARATGQHLLDSQAGAALAARLVELQRHKLAQVQTLDRRARRALHDDILPLLHGALLELSAQTAPNATAPNANAPNATAPNATAPNATAPTANAMALLTEAHKAISDLLREAPAPDSPLARRDFFAVLKLEIEGELSGHFALVEWQIGPRAGEFTSQLPALLADTLFFAAREAVRNAAKYGRGGDSNRALNLQICAQIEGDFRLEIRDDGVGIAGAAPTKDASPDALQSGGSGSGLSLHAAMLAIAGGSLRVDDAPGGGALVALNLPVALAAMQGFSGPMD